MHTHVYTITITKTIRHIDRGMITSLYNQQITLKHIFKTQINIITFFYKTTRKMFLYYAQLINPLSLRRLVITSLCHYVVLLLRPLRIVPATGPGVSVQPFYMHRFPLSRLSTYELLRVSDWQVLFAHCMVQAYRQVFCQASFRILYLSPGNNSACP